jgi:condensin-2 complex subunit H2
MLFLVFVVPAAKASRKIRFKVKHRVSMSTLFPLAKLHGPISPELMEMWEMRRCAHQRQKDSQSTPLYEKVLFDG